MGFLTICLFFPHPNPQTEGSSLVGLGITILQMSKVDPTTLKLDRRSTLLLQANRQHTELQEKSISGFEE